MLAVVTDRNGNQLHQGDDVYRPGEFQPCRVVAIDTYRARPVQVRVGFMREEGTIRPAYAWYRGDQVEVV